MREFEGKEQELKTQKKKPSVAGLISGHRQKSRSESSLVTRYLKFDQVCCQG